MTTNDGCRADVRKARAAAAQPDPTATAVRAAQAEALREAADEWGGGPTGAAPIPIWWLRDRADRLATDTAAPEGVAVDAPRPRIGDVVTCIQIGHYGEHPARPDCLVINDAGRCTTPESRPEKCWRHDYNHREYVCRCNPPREGDTGMDDPAAPVAVEGVETVTVRRPRVPFGPKGVPANQADARYLRDAAGNIEFSRCMGSNLTATVTALLREVADVIAASPVEPETSEPEGGVS